MEAEIPTSTSETALSKKVGIFIAKEGQGFGPEARRDMRFTLCPSEDRPLYIVYNVCDTYHVFTKLEDAEEAVRKLRVLNNDDSSCNDSSDDSANTDDS